MTSSTIAYAKFIRYGYSKHVPFQKVIDECKWLENKLKIPCLNRSNLYSRILMPIGFGPKDFKMCSEMIFFRSNKFHLLENLFSDVKAALHTSASMKQHQPVTDSSPPKQKKEPK